MTEGFAGRVAARIRELREARGLSLRQLSKRSGLAPESVSRSERGLHEVTLTNLAKIAGGLGVDLPTFFAFDTQPTWERVMRDEDARSAALIVGSVPARERQRLLDLLVVALGRGPARLGWVRLGEPPAREPADDASEGRSRRRRAAKPAKKAPAKPRRKKP